MQIFYCFLAKKQKKIPTSLRDSYTHMLHMIPPLVLKRVQSKVCCISVKKDIDLEVKALYKRRTKIEKSSSSKDEATFNNSSF